MGNVIKTMIDPSDAVMLLIDHQSGLFQLVRDMDLLTLRHNVSALAKVSRLAKIPTFTTASVPDGPNLDAAFDEYELQLAKLAGNERKFLLDAPLVVANAAFALAGPITGNYALSLLAAGSSVIGLPSIKDLWETGREIVHDGAALYRTPIAMLVEPE